MVSTSLTGGLINQVFATLLHSSAGRSMFGSIEVEKASLERSDPVPKYKIQKLAPTRIKTGAGQTDHRIGAVWETIAVKSNKATAERIAQHARVDNPDRQIRIEESRA